MMVDNEAAQFIYEPLTLLFLHLSVSNINTLIYCKRERGLPLCFSRRQNDDKSSKHASIWAPFLFHIKNSRLCVEVTLQELYSVGVEVILTHYIK